jgi:hypothetical protein
MSGATDLTCVAHATSTISTRSLRLDKVPRVAMARTVIVIDRSGSLLPSDSPYDSRAAGVLAQAISLLQ